MDQASTDGLRHLSTLVHLSTVHLRPSFLYMYFKWSVVHEVNGLSSSGRPWKFSLSTVLIRPWSGRSIVKNLSTRLSQNYNLGPASEFVLEMGGLSPNFGPLSTWTDGRPADGRLRPWRPVMKTSDCCRLLNFYSLPIIPVIRLSPDLI